jgi:hypothetical protein
MRNIPAMIELTQSMCFAKGYHRACYIHPEDENLCIKVSLAADNGETESEIKYYRHLQRRGVSWDMLPRFHGRTDTTIGSGAVFDLIRDDDGEISKSLMEYFKTPELTETIRAGLADAFIGLKNYLIAERIVTRTIKPKNVLYQKRDSGSGRLFIIDNIGNTDFIRLADYLGAYARMKIARKWQRFEADALVEYATNPALGELFGPGAR